MYKGLYTWNREVGYTVNEQASIFGCDIQGLPVPGIRADIHANKHINADTTASSDDDHRARKKQVATRESTGGEA